MTDFDPLDPQPGWYRRKLVKGGPWVGVRIWIEQGEREECPTCQGRGTTFDRSAQCDDCYGEGSYLISDDIIRAEVDGIEADPFAAWSWCAKHPISESEYAYILGAAAWDRENDPDAPTANPRRAIDLNRTKPVF